MADQSIHHNGQSPLNFEISCSKNTLTNGINRTIFCWEIQTLSFYGPSKCQFWHAVYWHQPCGFLNDSPNSLHIIVHQKLFSVGNAAKTHQPTPSGRRLWLKTAREALCQGTPSAIRSLMKFPKFTANKRRSSRCFGTGVFRGQFVRISYVCVFHFPVGNVWDKMLLMD